MSHLRVVQDALLDDLESYVVFEDDAVFHPHASGMLTRFLAELPEDWDQIYFGGQHLQTPEPIPDRPFVLRGINVNRTHAFAVRRTIFARFAQHIMHAPDYMVRGAWHIDHQLGLAHERRDWNVYCPAWWMVGQDAGCSNISGRDNPRLWWQPVSYSRLLPFIFLPLAASQRLVEWTSRFVHFGNSLKPSTKEDIGLDQAAQSDKELGAWLEMIAREAMDMGLLPGWQHPRIGLKDVRRVWASGAFEAKRAPLEKWIDYPFNGLFLHPLNRRGSRRSEG